eukprot:NODE_75_length_2225_cov_331.817972.p1 GENE.NODE_75_length_2225_cov_331.817972~~NODE_75_length_2225_cov_331.817972.p1  ORF type:complete len:705 (+),score=354.41 NODE_75_length_2225_cov_331.817972:3-2117(+)
MGAQGVNRTLVPHTRAIIVLVMSPVSATILLLATATASSLDGGVGPIEKVLQLLADLQGKINAEGAASEKAFTELTALCEERTAVLGNEIKTGKAEAEDLTAGIEHATAAIEGHNTEIEKATTSIATSEKDLKAATEIRAKEEAHFKSAEADTLEVISALERAVNILEREARKGGAAMVQVEKADSVVQALEVMVQAAMLGSRDAQTLAALLQNKAHDNGAPDAAVYENHSGSIVDTLSDLLEKARSQLDDARHKETSAVHNFEMLQQSLQDSVKYAGEDLAAAKVSLAEQTEAKALATGDLQETSKTLAANTDALASLEASCAEKTEDHKAETKSRAEELAALAEAKRVIEEKTGGAVDVTYSLQQESFLQAALSQMKTGADLANFEVVQFVRKLAREQHSDRLAQLGRHIVSALQAGARSGEDPFAKVKGLISGLIERLEGEAKADAEHKAYCDKELAYNQEKQAKRVAADNKLTTEIDANVARSAMLKEQVAALQKALADLANMQVEMDKLRETEHAQYAKDKPEMENGIEGVKLALKVLRDYYAKGDAAHEAAGDAAGGIIGILEVVESDFTKNLAEMTTVEKAAQADYERGTKENEVERTTKEQDVKYKEKEIGQLAKALAEATADRDGVRKELAAINEQLEKLTEMCVPKAETYEARKAKREAEIAGLQEALTILENEAALLQREGLVRRHQGLLRGA